MMQAAQVLNVTVVLILKMRMMSWMLMTFKSLSGNLCYSHLYKLPISPHPPLHFPYKKFVHAVHILLCKS